MNIQQLRATEICKANHLIADFDKDVNADCGSGVDTEKYCWIRRRFEDVIFGISIFMVLFLLASVIAIAFYTVM
jgi:hypothetical protein